MARKIQPREATAATTGIACLVGAAACVLISSVYLTHDTGWPQFALSAFSAAAVCAVGASALGFAAYQQFVVKRSLFADHDREFDYRTAGQWAVVTGATDGIGKEYARQLAADHGMDVLLVGRNPNKLRAVAELIRKESGGSGRRVMTVVADFAEDPVARDGPCGSAAAAAGAQETVAADDGHGCGRDDLGDRCYCDAGGDESAAAGRGDAGCTRWYPRLRAAIESPPVRAGGVGVLINCAGVSYPHPEYFACMTGDGATATGMTGDGDRGGPAFTTEFFDNADAAVRCNVAAAVHACRLVLPGMLARGRGLVVNVGSASASVPPGTPLMTLYAATKKFLERLSADLDDECAHLTRDSRDGGFGVRVQCVRPAYVATAMLRSANPDVRGAPAGGAADGDSDSEDERDGEDYGNEDWWTVRRKRFEDAAERWLVPSARRWVRSALRHGGRLYARRCRGADGPANFTGYWPHTLLVGTLRLASALTPRRWYVDRVLMPGMLKYREKGRAAVARAAAGRRGRNGDDAGGERKSADDETGTATG